MLVEKVRFTVTSKNRKTRKRVKQRQVVEVSYYISKIDMLRLTMQMQATLTPAGHDFVDISID